MSKTIAVLDGNSLMHRAYHAIQTPMSAPDSTPTNAVFGFLQMFCKFVETASPDAVICAFDEGKPEHRIADLPQYKAQRPHMDDELRVQFPIIEELLEAMNVPVVKIAGWEGDDILGTIAARDEKLGFNTLLVTGDKDACQLATSLTSIVTTKKGISDVAILGPDEVMEKYGVTPSQFIDYLGLMGDSSDNIPGVPGIGPKSATKLLEQYGNIEGIYAHIDELKGKQRENLVENEDLAYLSRQIATIVTDLDFPLDIENASFPNFDSQTVSGHFKKYALASPLTRVLKFIGESAAVERVEIDFEPLTRETSKARELIDDAIKCNERIGIAFNTTGEDTIFGPVSSFAFATSRGCAELSGEDAIEAFVHICRNGQFAALNLKQTIQAIYPADTALEARIGDDELYAIDAFDLHLAQYELTSTANDYSLERLSQQYLGGGLPEVGDEDALARNAEATRLLVPKMEDSLAKDGSDRVYYKIDLPLVYVLCQIERTGVDLDVDALSTIGRQTAASLEELTAQIYKLAGEPFNIDSPKQLSRILFEVMGLTPIKKNSRGYSTDASVLNELAKTEEIASLVIKYRELSKIKGSFIDSLPKMRGADKRLHTVFHETVTATGRLSSSDPNLQNIPVRSDFGRQIRTCFIPFDADSVFLSADYSQIELRLLANMSGDEHLIEAFNSGADFHAQTAARVFGIDPEKVTPELRSRAKAVNFGIVYGQQAYGLSQTLDIEFSEAKDMIDRYFDAYPKVREYLDSIVDAAKKTGFAQTLEGRKRHIPELRSSNKQQFGVGQRTAMNHPLQGTAADIIKLAMIDVAKRLKEGGFRAKMILQVHDELDFSVSKDEIEALSAMVKEAMEGVYEFEVPLLVDISWGPDWASAH